MVTRADLHFSASILFEEGVHYLLLPEDWNGWWEGYVTNLYTITGMDDLKGALVMELRSMHYHPVQGSLIGVTPGEKGSYVLEVLFRSDPVSDEEVP